VVPEVMEQPVEQPEEQETLHLQDRVHLQIMITIIIIIIRRVGDNDAFQNYSMKTD